MMNNHIVPQSEHLLQDACYIIEQAKSIAFKAVNDTLVKRNWLLGMRIQHEVLQDQRAEYGEQVIRNLAASSGLSWNTLRILFSGSQLPCDEKSKPQEETKYRWSSIVNKYR